MKWPDRERDAPHGESPHLWVDATGRLGVSPDYVAQADNRFEAICEELGILLARHVEPVSARVLPFGTEQLAMVQLRDASAEVHAAAARGASAAAAVAGAAIDAVTGGRSVLAAALPGAVAEGKVRTAVVFSEGEAPVRWGLADDETRLASLFAVVPHLGSFTATAGADTYRVLRLPGIGVALVSEGPSAAAWVEGWFAALIQATQFALRVATTPTDLVAVADPEPPPAPDPAPSQAPDDSRVAAFHVIEEECRRILAAAQDEARAIRAIAEQDAAEHVAASIAARDRATQVPATAAAVDTSVDPGTRVDSPLPPDSPWRRTAHRSVDDLDRRERDAPSAEPPPSTATGHAMRDDRVALLDEAREAAERIVLEAEHTREAVIAESRRDTERAIADAERTRSSLLAEARRDGDSVLREVERARATLLTEAKREADSVLREAERTRATLLDDAKREAEAVLRDCERTRSTMLADATRETQAMVREAERMRSTLLEGARREADSIRRDAESLRRDAEQAARDADQLRADAERDVGDPREAESVAVGDDPRRDTDKTGDLLIGEARRIADGIIHDARRSADELIRDAADVRRRGADLAGVVHPEPGTARAAGAPLPATPPQDATAEATAALLAAAATSMTAMSELLSRVQLRPTDDAATRGAATSPADLPDLFFGA
ncbi:MAG TPA: hypothetical protein VIE15_01725 [Acidimicrobiales bacterium]|jgi:hypothetical protein